MISENVEKLAVFRKVMFALGKDEKTFVSSLCGSATRRNIEYYIKSSRG